MTIELVSNFWQRVDASGPGCWEWIPGKEAREKMTKKQRQHAYGRFSLGKRHSVIGAHRFSALLAGMDIEGLEVRHKCDNPPCVRPSHLTTGSHAENIQDAVQRKRMRGVPKITAEDVLEARTLRSQGWLAKDLAKKFGIAGSSMFSILNGTNWKDVPMPNAEYEKARKEQCLNGHLWSEHGVQYSKQMVCQICSRDYNRERMRIKRKREREARTNE